MDTAKIYRDAFTNIYIREDGSWGCWVTGLNAPCGCFACNASARKGCAAVAAALAAAKATDETQVSSRQESGGSNDKA